MPGSICFVGLDNYPVLNPDWGDHYFGGESVQQTLLAKAFLKQGYSVSMIVADLGQPDEEVIDGIRVIKAYSTTAGLPVLRFFHPRLTTLFSVLRKADAEIYYQSCAGMLTGVVGYFCKRHARRFLFRVAHDSDCIPDQQLIRYWRDKKIYEYGLRQADAIAAQGVEQVDLLGKHYALTSAPINMTVNLPVEKVDQQKDIDVLWVNNFRDFKRPELVPTLAAQLPELKIMMIGGAVPGYENLYQQVMEKAKGVGNLSFAGAVPYHEVGEYFSRSKIFINTSDWEGFPNSFLQAWSFGLPVVSFFDPDGLISNMRLGSVPQGVSQMTEHLKQLIANEGAQEEIGKRARSFVAENYAPAAVIQQYEKLLSTLGGP